MGFESWFAAIGLPVVFLGDFSSFFLEFDDLRRFGIGRFAFAMENRNRVRDARDKGSRRETIFGNADAVAAGEIFGKAVGLVERERQLMHRDLESDVAHVVERREAMMRDFVDVEGKFSLNMLMLALGVIHRTAVLRAEFRKLNWNRKVSGLRVANGVADVVGECSDSEGEFIRVVRVAEEVDDEIAGAHVMREVGERLFAEGIVADVLDNAAAVGIGTGTVELGLREVGV